ncbi:hypothetical protein CSAL01_04755 [Colletotrichum salicis]|uniref:Short-chain dehydrogenase n=1 Tax=Colletotrichum salicis TaxID=1209931 RepID=A0A135UH14_9PEZI|nr:hypothetical protein CSAL01_04755 [Colletotrichum salicis]
MSLPYQKILLVGATSGIGALAHKLVQNGTFVVVAGRRKENLDQFVAKHGDTKAAAAVVDILKLESEHTDLDCVFLNAGVQRGIDFTKPEDVSLDIIHDELLANYLSHDHLPKAFLPHLSKQDKQTALLYTTSQLGLIPMKRCPNYSGSKAAMHGFILALRSQLKNASSKVKIVEVYPPAVQTELHDTKNQPDLKNGHAIGMPVDEFANEVYQRWVNEEDQIPVGTAKPMFDAFKNKRQDYYESFNGEMDRVLVVFTV